jgi:hypothetical protein
MIDGTGHPDRHSARFQLQQETTMLKTISAALLAVTVLVAPALAASPATKTAHPVTKSVQIKPVTKSVQIKPGVRNANARMGHHHLSHHRHFRHDRHSRHHRFHKR